MDKKDTQASRFLKNTGWLLFGKVFHMLLTLVVTGMLSRYLGTELYGILNYGLAFVEVFTIICKLGIDGILVHELVKAREAAKQGSINTAGDILGTTIGLRLISSGISLLLIYGIVSLLQPGKTVMITVTVIQSVSLFFVAFDTLEYFFQAELDSRYAVLARSISYPAVCAFRLLLIFLQADIRWFGWAVVLDALLIAVFLWIFLKKTGCPSLRFRTKTAKSLLSRSRHFIAVGLLVMIYTQMDKIMVGSLSTASEVGIYSAAMMIANLWIFVPNALLDSGRPVIMEKRAEGDNEGYEKRLRQICSGILWISIAAGILFTILGWLAIRIIYGEQYQAANGVLILLIWSRLFSQMGAVRSVWMLCEGMEKYIKYFIGLGAGINLLLNYLLIPRYGAFGAAAATLITEVVSSALATGLYSGTASFVKIWFGSLIEIRYLNISDLKNLFRQ